MPYEELCKGVVKLVNQWRDAKGMKLIRKIPKGLHSSYDCPIRRALFGKYGTIDSNRRVSSNYITFATFDDSAIAASVWGGGSMRSSSVLGAPKAITEFVDLFDAGQLPEYDVNTPYKED